jgi:GWxTD domain-containing protein
MRPRSLVLVFPLVLLILCSSFAAAKDATKLLPPRYREWLTRDVAYIITNQEKDAFLQLTSDDARDKFIDRFWEVRNPTPGAPDNPYKTEHYRRLEYANEYFGHASHTEGWRTDMGRVYITLGEPQQRQKLLGLQKITPMEIWFYQNADPALPPYFYVIFYQRDLMSEFKLYSPYNDGPEKLITAEVDPSRSDALKVLSDDAGRDVARESLSLLTDEPVDLNSGTVSLQSDVMLATIRNLANNPISQRALEARRQALEDVTHRIILDNDYLDVVTVPLRDPSGQINLHYLLRFKKPEDFTVAQAAKGRYYYSALVSVRVSLMNGKPVIGDEKKISKNLSSDELEVDKSKIFGYEGMLPLAPNKYKIEFQLTNLLSNTAFSKQVEVTVPDTETNTLQVSSLVPFSEASMTGPQAGLLPFSGAGVKFLPLAGQELQLNPGQDLKFFYQVWDTGALREPRAGKKLEVDYSYGRMGARDTQTIHDEIPLEQLDAGGSIINGKRIPTVDLSPGNYRLAMTLRDPATDAKAFGFLNFSIYSAAPSIPAWDVSDDNRVDNVKDGHFDYWRAVSYAASGNTAKALEWFQKAYSHDPENEAFRSKLIELYFGKQQYSDVAQLYSKDGINKSTDEETILRIAESFDKTGQTGKAVAVMESGTQLNPSSGPLLIALANYYRKAGDLQKAAAAEQKGKEFLAAAHSQS